MVIGEFSTFEKFEALGRPPRLFIAIMTPGRVFGGAFSVDLEWNHYRPHTPKADEFHVANDIRFGGVTWAVLSVPRRDWSIAEKVAAKYGLRLADGIPTMVSGGKIEHFPMRGRNVYTLEADTKAEHYKEFERLHNTEPKTLYELERKMIFAIYAKYGVTPPADRFAGNEVARAEYVQAAQRAAKRN